MIIPTPTPMGMAFEELEKLAAIGMAGEVTLVATFAEIILQGEEEEHMRVEVWSKLILRIVDPRHKVQVDYKLHYRNTSDQGPF